MKIYNGIDICSIDRIAKAVEKFGEKFISKVFTSKEIIEATTKNGTYDINYLAKRFAGKEAFSKAIGMGIGSISFKDISILRGIDGAPELGLSNEAISYLLKTKNWLNYDVSISLSDEGGINKGLGKGLAVASVVILAKISSPKLGSERLDMSKLQLQE